MTGAWGELSKVSWDQWTQSLSRRIAICLQGGSKPAALVSRYLSPASSSPVSLYGLAGLCRSLQQAPYSLTTYAALSQQNRASLWSGMRTSPGSNRPWLYQELASQGGPWSPDPRPAASLAWAAEDVVCLCSEVSTLRFFHLTLCPVSTNLFTSSL